jgi:hypothetical protein
VKTDRLSSRVDQLDAVRDLVENPAVIDLPRRLRTHQAIMIATLSDQERIVLRGATIQHPQSPRAGIEADDIAIAKMLEAGPEPHRDRVTLAFAGREMLSEENRRLESACLRGQKILSVADQGAIPLIQFGPIRSAPVCAIRAVSSNLTR